ncbi:hypothetical protein QO009_003052 [Brevibacillus aydinogluensis]|uniref:hypothetical protein n=1 Tax=Brevibacillus aydinogluensis TaxID=927786 RepID=UPI0028935467|nr:hypothetical protein [Brevibacillus aydinogluensis]MDT3417157.1 hypothetical protein [Brevibacillus aydinogluensis]
MQQTQTVVFDLGEVQERQQRLREALKNIELAKIALAEYYLDTQAWEIGMSQAYPHLPISVIQEHEITESYVRFVMEGVLPIIFDKSDAKYHRKVREHYMNQMVQFVTTNHIQRKFAPAFVLLAQYFPDMKIRDLDNRSKSFIFNGLRYSGLIQEDSWFKLSYMDCGFLDKENPRTEIWVCNQSDMFEVLEEIKVKSEGRKTQEK